MIRQGAAVLRDQVRRVMHLGKFFFLSVILIVTACSESTPGGLVAAAGPREETTANAQTRQTPGSSWFVDRDATDPGDGKTWSSAWATFREIRWGYGGVQPGDTIFISGGSSSKSYAEQLVVGASGRPGSEITIRVGQETGHNGTVVISNPSGVGIVIRDRAYVTVDGSVNNMQRLRISGCASHGVHVLKNSHHIKLTYLEVDNNGNKAEHHGIYMNHTNSDHSPAVEVSCSLIHDNWQDQIKGEGERGPKQYGRFLIHHNRIYNLTDDGIEHDMHGLDFFYNHVSKLRVGKGRGHPDGLQILAGYARIYNNVFADLSNPQCKDSVNAYIFVDIYSDTEMEQCCVRVFNNLVYQTQDPVPKQYWRGLSLAAEGKITALTDVLIANNTFVGLPAWGSMMFFRTQKSHKIRDIVYVNNIIDNCFRLTGGEALSLSPGEYTVGSWGDKAGVTIDYNVISAGPAGKTTIAYKSGWYRYADWERATGCQRSIAGNPAPLLDGAYRLNAKSPARGTGINLSDQFTMDLSGKVRPKTQNWDIGAYQHGTE